MIKKIYRFKNFKCDVEVFEGNSSSVIVFNNMDNDLKSEEIRDLVIVPNDYGYIKIKKVDKETVICSGFLDKRFFNEDMIDDIMENYLKNELNVVKYQVDYWHIELVKTDEEFCEYNGEY